MNEIKWYISAFDKLDTISLHNIFQLRSEVFVVEQDCVYQDIDGKDIKAFHLQGYIENRLVAYCRLFKAGDYFTDVAIGRVIISSKYRKHGYGHTLMDKAIEEAYKLLGKQDIVISAQLRLKSFYETHGFVKISEVYQEDGIPHIRMKRYA